MSLEIIEFESGPDPRASLIVLHGLGADGHDFVPICEELDLSAAGAVRFVFPSAPPRPVSLNAGHVMRAWYDISQPSPGGVRREDEAGLRASQATVQGLIEREIERAQRAVGRDDEVVTPTVMVSLGTGVLPLKKVMLCVTFSTLGCSL